MTDFLQVKAKRTFAVSGVGLKTRKSDPFKMEASEARFLAAQDYLEILEDDDKPADEAPVAPAPKKKAKPHAPDQNS